MVEPGTPRCRSPLSRPAAPEPRPGPGSARLGAAAGRPHAHPAGNLQRAAHSWKRWKHKQVGTSVAQLTLEVLALVPVPILTLLLVLALTVTVTVFLILALVEILLLVPVPLWPTPDSHAVRVQQKLGSAAQPGLDLPVSTPLLHLQDKQVPVATETHLDPLAQIQPLARELQAVGAVTQVGPDRQVTI